MDVHRKQISRHNFPSPSRGQISVDKNLSGETSAYKLPVAKYALMKFPYTTGVVDAGIT